MRSPSRIGGSAVKHLGMENKTVISTLDINSEFQ